MKNVRSSNGSSASSRSKKTKTSNFRKNDPFARPPHPLGYQFLSEERPLRASKVGSVLPSLVAKYGLGRKIGVERMQNAWREALDVVFAQRSNDEFYQESDEPSSKLATFLKYAKPVSFRAGALRVEIVSNLLYQELQFYSSAILKEIQKRLPDENVKTIKLIVR